MNQQAISANELLQELLSSNGMSEIFAILIAVLTALITSRITRTIGRRWSNKMVESVAIFIPYLIALMVIGLTQPLAIKLGLADNVLGIAARLVAALGVLRCALFGLRITLGAGNWFIYWEARIAWILSIGIMFEIVGWFNILEATLDSIDLIPGKASFSLWTLLKGIVVVTGFILLMSLISRALERRVMSLEELALSTRVGISKFAYFFLIGLGVLLGINAAGVDLTALTVLTGAIGLGLGFGLQAIASNFVSGFVLLMDKSIKPGDVISFTQHTGTSTENFGWVQELRGRFVVVRDRDGVETLVPNQNLITNAVINWSYSDQRVRLRLPVLVSYDNDPEIALALLIEATCNHPRILREPAPVSRLMSFEDYGMKLEARFWIRDPMNGVNNVRSDINRIIWRLFRDNKIKIPVAQHEIRVLSTASRNLDNANSSG